MLKTAGVLLAGSFLLIVLGFWIYVSDYYHAEESAVSVMQTDDGVHVEEKYTVLSPSVPADTGLIFYPGAKVETIAYLPLLEKLKQQGITCILVDMPFHLAIFDADAAEDIFGEFPEIRNWYIGGHSMGGAMASSYASDHQDRVKGLILLGAYLYGDYPVESTLTIYGSLNTSVEEKLDYTKNVVVIEGGNHAQFGNYGKQKGDSEALISAEEQQKQAAEAILQFIK